VLLPPGIDLLILDGAPLELAGRVAIGGRLLFDDDPAARVRWEAMTRKIYSDELPRLTRAHRESALSSVRASAWRTAPIRLSHMPPYGGFEEPLYWRD
jgi:hypothetical protein